MTKKLQIRDLEIDFHHPITQLHTRMKSEKKAADIQEKKHNNSGLLCPLPSRSFACTSENE